MATTSSSPMRTWALAAAIGGFSILALYIGIIVSQGDVEWASVAVVTAFIATASGAALVGAAASSVRLARWMLRVSAVEFGVLGIIALFSIGVFLIAAAVLAMVAVSRIDREIATDGGASNA